MKAIKLLVFSMVAFSFSGCDEELFDIKFGINQKEFTYTIDPTTTAGDIILDPTTQAINLDSLAKANGADINKIKSVKITSIKAHIESPAAANFNVLKSGQIDVGITGDPDFDLLRIAEFTEVDVVQNSQDLTIKPTGADILPYAKQPILTVSGKLVTNGPVVEKTVIKLTIDFEVVANPLAK